jgi:hypothetical protein
MPTGSGAQMSAGDGVELGAVVAAVVAAAVVDG